ncbi:hypothetical protein Acin_2132 [Acidaminococcus intestini RyC-MR95]|uniref:Uncharacterized protein n=1 Tax=Acidaminococcus intestini (strain RyC-MR95) TaxID=568816 RepID=G4Q5F4_ACIIR|nr:hypothetical protein Acin_2132 [Acidaminococcus intestini RyC-MR95]
MIESKKPHIPTLFSWWSDFIILGPKKNAISIRNRTVKQKSLPRKEG